MEDNYDVIVIGSGLGGSVCAALLAKAGMRTLLLEKNNRPGGKAMGISVNGFRGEMWPTFGIPMHRGPFIDAFRALGIESKLDIRPGSFAMMYRRKGGNWTTYVDPPGKPVQDPTANLFDSWGLDDPKEREACLTVLAEIFMMTPEQLDQLDDVSVQQWLDERKDVPPPIRGFLATHSNLMATGVYELVSMSEIARVMQIFAGGETGYPRGGYGRLIDELIEVLRVHGGKLLTGARVEKITVEEGRVTGVATKDKAFKAPIVVSNAGIQPTVLKLVGREHFDRSYVGYVIDIVPSLGFTNMRYIFSQPVMKHGVYVATTEDTYLDIERLDRMRDGIIPDEIALDGVVPSHFDPDMAPPGKQMLNLGTWCTPDPSGKELKALHKKINDLFVEMFPEAVSHIERIEGHVGPAEVSSLSRDQVLPGVGGEAAGLAVTVGYCGKNKPKPKSPLPGLFFVGHDAGGAGYLATHQAVSSGMNVAQLVHFYWLERRSVVRI
ncbi:MAG: NAD(P)/FAD-dependent oxidoreductase [Deltaproteobacteria bacterium]|nr:NAD(P)/FAD-dependent oxidoreductase [Deltaproteobacteria bacterium]